MLWECGGSDSSLPMSPDVGAPNQPPHSLASLIPGETAPEAGAWDRRAGAPQVSGEKPHSPVLSSPLLLAKDSLLCFTLSLAHAW